jgi:hypothetical protein
MAPDKKKSPGLVCPRVFFTLQNISDARSHSPQLSGENFQTSKLGIGLRDSGSQTPKLPPLQIEHDLAYIKAKIAKASISKTKLSSPRRYSLADCTASSAHKYNLYSKKLDENFEVIVKIGTGGFGSVFKVKDISTGKFFALKVLESRCKFSEISFKKSILARIQKSSKNVTLHLSHSQSL